MILKPEEAMWCVIMFDLPTQKKAERREAAQFRKLLLECGFSMIQFSVYAKYSPTVESNMKIEKIVRKNLPERGEVRIFHLTDNQWASATRIIARAVAKNEETPDQLTLF